MKKIILSILLIKLLFTAYSQSNTPCGIPLPPLLIPGATCTNTNGTTVGATYQSNAANGGTPSCASPGAPDVWYRFIAPVGGSVNIQTTAGSITDAGMSLYSGGCPNSFTQILCDDDSGPGLMPQINATSLIPGQTYYIRIWQYGGSGTGTFSICLTIPSPAANNTNCSQPSPICSGSPINFTANTGGTPAQTVNPGNNYGCLATTPNPSWYYLEIATGGNLIIDISAGSDVDFAIWGPYANLTNAIGNCNSHGAPVDCSYSTAAVEQVSVPGVTTSQVYVLLVTNYANTIQNINVSNSGGTATTNCGIVPLPVGLVDFKANLVNDLVSLNWTTSSEQNNDYFVVQHSSDIQIWNTIDVVDGAGTTNTQQFYTSRHNKPMNGINYYRLMQVDTDGSYYYSPIRAVDTKSDTDFELFPNPASSEVYLKGIEFDDISELFLLDVSGQRTSLDFSVINGMIQTEVNIIEKGAYTLCVRTINGEPVNKRLMIQ